MRSPQSWTSSIVGLALALLLVSWAIEQFVHILEAIWPLLVALGCLAFLVPLGIRYWRQHDYW